jgi:predicted nucleotidyltransferase
MKELSRENDILKLFLLQPTKHWHFKEISKIIDISDNKLSKWLNKLKNDKLIIKIKKKGKMPHYIANYDSPHYKNTKKLFALNVFYQSGLLDYLSSSEGIKSAIIFGSFSRSDWHNESDIDIFVYGDDKNLNLGKFQKKLNHEIQLFSAKNSSDLKKFGPGLLKTIIKGINVKGDIVEEVIKYASV